MMRKLNGKEKVLQGNAVRVVFLRYFIKTLLKIQSFQRNSEEGAETALGCSSEKCHLINALQEPFKLIVLPILSS